MNIKFFFLFSVATYGARVRGNVFRIIFLILDKEFEYVETSSGFASLQGFFFEFQQCILIREFLHEITTFIY